jgi:starch synthase
MAANKRILFVTQEIKPYLPESESSVLGRELPRLSQEDGYEVRTFMPRFGSINERRNQLHEVIRLSGINIPIDDADHPLIIKVASMQPSRIQVYFIDNEDYFTKSADDVDEVGSNRADNDERVIFYTRGTMETVKKLRWEATVIHCMGWFSALTPLYIRTAYNTDPSFRGSKVVYSVMPGPEPAVVDPKFIKKMVADGIPNRHFKEFGEPPYDVKTLHKMAIKFSSGVVFATDEPDSELLEYAQKLKLPVLLKEQVKEDLSGYVDFYNQLSTNGKKK